MKLYDVSMCIEPTMAVYKNKEEKKPIILQSAFFDKQGVYETTMTMNLHTGTHIDFPLHTLPNGKTSRSYDLTTFLGKAKVFDLTHVVDHISKADLINLPIENDDFVLFKTKNSFSEAFEFEFIYVDISAANYLVEKHVRGVGVDALGIERAQPNHPTHDALLGNNIVILEGLRLKDVVAKTYPWVALPLKIDDVEALPVRVVLIDDEV